jgi:hypothetical protein
VPEIKYGCKADVHDHTCKVKSTSPDDMSTSISYLAQKLRLSTNSDPMDPFKFPGSRRASVRAIRAVISRIISPDDRPDHFACMQALLGLLP